MTIAVSGFRDRTPRTSARRCECSRSKGSLRHFAIHIQLPADFNLKLRCSPPLLSRIVQNFGSVLSSGKSFTLELWLKRTFGVNFLTFNFQ
jgi:hypothetical protein